MRIFKYLAISFLGLVAAININVSNAGVIIVDNQCELQGYGGSFPGFVQGRDAYCFWYESSTFTLKHGKQTRISSRHINSTCNYSLIAPYIDTPIAVELHKHNYGNALVTLTSTPSKDKCDSSVKFF